MWSPERSLEDTTLCYYIIHFIYWWLISFVGLGLVRLDISRKTTSGITRIPPQYCNAGAWLSFYKSIFLVITDMLFVSKCLERVNEWWMWTKCFFLKMVMRDIPFFHDTIINIFINCICCRPSDANRVCQPHYCASDKLRTVFACEENACL